MLRQATANTTSKPVSPQTITTSDNSQEATHTKPKRGISPFSRGTSPFRRNDGKPRGMSPFRKNSPTSVARKAFSKRQSSSGSSLGSSIRKRDESKEDLVVCHGSARSIVFRDQLRLAAKIIKEETDQDVNSDDNSLSEREEEERGFASMDASLKDSLRESIQESLRDAEEIEGQQVHLTPLPKLELGPTQVFEALDQDRTTDLNQTHWTRAEQDVYQLLKSQQACVKTIKNSEWPSFLQRFQTPKQKEKFSRYPDKHNDIAPHEGFPFNSFVTSTSLLPELGKKMRCYGSLHSYPVGVVFGLPHFESAETEDQVATETQTWSWPAGYAAKTEFNIERGQLINGRQEALKSLSQMRQYNHEYLHNQDHYIGGRIVKGGFQVVPYNEVFLRVGGRGRIANGVDVVTREAREDSLGTGRSYETGTGLPVALFIRSTTIGDILTLFRTKARLEHVLGANYIRGIPLLVITPDHGVRVFSDDLQHEFWKLAAHRVNPFQNPILEPMLKVDDPNQNYLRQKALEQITFFDDDDSDDGEDSENNTGKRRHHHHLPSYLTIEECARLAGGFGATDECLAKILEQAREQDLQEIEEEDDDDPELSRHYHHGRRDSLSKVMAAGLDAALRSNDYYTARQLLIVYSIVSTGHYQDMFEHDHNSKRKAQGDSQETGNKESSERSGYDADIEDPESLEFSYRVSERSVSERSTASAVSTVSSSLEQNLVEGEEEKSSQSFSGAPLAFLDTWRLRNATNSQGILFVLGAVEILSAVRNGDAQGRTVESISAIEEWVQYGEDSVAFRIASWSKQRATEHDTNVALEGSSQFMAFVSNKAITNRKGFAHKLNAALGAARAGEGEESHLRYLKGIQEIVNSLHAPCLRLEILQYILGLDNRFSVDHIRHSTELAVTCMALGLCELI